MLQRQCGARITIPIMSRGCGQRFVISEPTVSSQTRKNRNKKTEIGCQLLSKTSLVLFLKSKVYRYTGVYLADKEEQEFMQTLGAQRDVERIFTKALEWGIESRDEAEGIVIGSWQCEHGFTRPVVTAFNFGVDCSRPEKVLHWFMVLYSAVSWDFARVWWRIGNHER